MSTSSSMRWDGVCKRGEITTHPARSRLKDSQRRVSYSLVRFSLKELKEIGIIPLLCPRADKACRLTSLSSQKPESEMTEGLHVSVKLLYEAMERGI